MRGWRLPVVLLLLLTAAVSVVVCWGPVSHQSFALFLLEATASGGEREISPSSFVLGSSAPDAVKHLSFTLHDFPFALAQLHFAAAHWRSPSSPPPYPPPSSSSPAAAAPSFDAISFALGYGAHLAADAVGHYNNAVGGFLNSTTDHYIEFAADTYYVLVGVPSTLNRTFVFERFTTDAETFVAAATAYYASLTAQPALNMSVAQVQASVASFERTVDEELLLIPLNKFAYQQVMQEDDTCRAATWPQTLAHLQLAQRWSLDTMHYWTTEVAVAPSTTLANVDAQMQQHVDALFASVPTHGCPPPPPPATGVR